MPPDRAAHDEQRIDLAAKQGAPASEMVRLDLERADLGRRLLEVA